jgi:peptidoglycan/LPS O-acetylase OafA/YrhL
VRASEAVRSQAQAPRPLLLKLLELRPAVWVGTISYSLYLTHILVKWTLLEQVRAMTPSIPRGLAVLVGGGVVISLVFGSLVHRLVERPFMLLTRRSGLR